jgi:hypothetical protein
MARWMIVCCEVCVFMLSLRCVSCDVVRCVTTINKCDEADVLCVVRMLRFVCGSVSDLVIKCDEAGVRCVCVYV